MKIDNPFFRWMGKLGDVVALNLLWLLCCLPIVTIGASTTALHYAARKMVTGESVKPASDFFRSFRLNFRQATLVWLALAALGVLVLVDLHFGFRTPGAMGNVFRGIGIVLSVLWLMEMSFAFPLLSRYEYRTGALLYDAFRVAVTHPMLTILCICLLILMPALAWFNADAFYYFLLPCLLVGGGAVALIVAVLLQPIFQRMEAKEDDHGV